MIEFFGEEGSASVAGGAQLLPATCPQKTASSSLRVIAEIAPPGESITSKIMIKSKRQEAELLVSAGGLSARGSRRANGPRISLSSGV